MYIVYRYNNTEDEPNLTDRNILFTLSDGAQEGSFPLTLSLLPIDDHPTEV